MQDQKSFAYQRAKEIFKRANFVNDLGIILDALSPGRCETHLVLLPKHLQQTQVAHAGVLATIADHTAGGAAMTLLDGTQYVLSIEFKINLLRPARGELIRCKSEVLKPGKTISVVESDVYSVSDAEETLVSKAIVTLAVLKNLPDERVR